MCTHVDYFFYFCILFLRYILYVYDANSDYKSANRIYRRVFL